MDSPLKALIDGDSIVYRIAFAAKDDPPNKAKATMQEYIVDSILMVLDDVKEYHIWISGDTNFRNEIAVTKPYKGNRDGMVRPDHWAYLREAMIKEWEATVTEGEEADDAIAIEATQHGNSIICSIDKDFLQVPGEHFNYVKGIRFRVEPLEGLRNFYTQILTGDRVDNVEGVYGIGPVKAAKLLANCTTEQEMYQVCLKAFGNVERVHENGKLLWLRRFSGQLWEPPLS